MYLHNCVKAVRRRCIYTGWDATSNTHRGKTIEGEKLLIYASDIQNK